MNQFTRDRRMTFGFDQVPNGLWTLPVSAGARIVLGWLHSHTDDFLNALTMNRAIRMLGSSRIPKYLDELETLGFVKVHRSESTRPTRFELFAGPYEDLCGQRRPLAPDGGSDWAEVGEALAPDGLTQMGSRRETHSETNHLRSVPDSEIESDPVPADIADDKLRDRITAVIERGSGHEVESIHRGLAPTATPCLLSRAIETNA